MDDERRDDEADDDDAGAIRRIMFDGVRSIGRSMDPPPTLRRLRLKSLLRVITRGDV